MLVRCNSPLLVCATGLRELDLEACYLLTDEHIRAVLMYCRGLRSLSLSGCIKITDATLKVAHVGRSGLQLVSVTCASAS